MNKEPKIFFITKIGNYEVKISQKYNYILGCFESPCLFITPKDCLSLSFFGYLYPSFGLREFECETSKELILINEISQQKHNLGEKSLLARIPFALLDKISQGFKDCLGKIYRELELKAVECTINFNSSTGTGKINGEVRSSYLENNSPCHSHSGFGVDSEGISTDLSNWIFWRRSPNDIPLKLLNIIITEITNGLNCNIKYLIKEREKKKK